MSTTTVSPPQLASTLLASVELVQQLQATNRQATPQERAVLANWMGWGPVAPAFEESARGSWADLGAQLRLLLGPQGFAQASAATPHSFFTDHFLAELLWQLATSLGFEGGRVLEPGCGSGMILGAAPSHLSLDMTGIEREPFSASVAHLRFPEAHMHVASLEDIVLVDESFDLVIGNVPFSRVRIYDREAGLQFSLHNYFLWRSLQALRPGGLAVVITSRYTLDARKDAQRTVLRHSANLLGAIRLPTGAHAAARTQVITDILVLQKKGASALTWQGHRWGEVSEDVIEGAAINQYFRDHRQHILGTPGIEHGLYGAKELTLTLEEPAHLAALSQAAVASLVEEARQHGARYVPPTDHTVMGEHLVRLRADGLKEGSYQLLDGHLIQIVDGEVVPVTRMVAEVTALVQLRDAALTLLEAERDLDRTDESLRPLRQTLNVRYESYLRSYGPIHRFSHVMGPPDPETGEQQITRRRPAALSAFNRDPDYPLVLGLEEYDETTRQARKAAIFSRRVHQRPSRKTRAETPGEALALCLDELGTLDLATIGRLLSIAPEQVPAALGELVYEDPQAGWQTASEYLSGNVREKLEAARAAAQEHPQRYARNSGALEAVLPEELAPEEITAMLGAPWIAPEEIAQFCQELFGLRPTISHEPLTASWQVRLSAGASFSATVRAAVTSEWGTTRIDAYELVELALNKRLPTLYDHEGKKELDESLAAQEKQRALAQRFSAWVWEDQERATRLATCYNRTFNAVVPRQYEGSHLTFPGMDAQWQEQLYSWQKDFVWRMVSSRSALCGHPVGAGKTTTEIAGAMTLRRLGLTSKAAIIVPNHLIEQITAEAQRLYPAAHILMISRDDLTRERRTLFAARVAYGDYDVVVMTHAAFGAIGVHPETEKAYLDARIADYRAALQQVDPRHKRSIKKLETAIERMRQRQKALLDRPHDGGVTFEQLGISYLIVDEAHLFKNLGLPSNLSELLVRPAKRATDLEMKLRWLEQHHAGRPFASLCTATPLSNSMVEAYVMAWYLVQGLLRDNGLRTVDAFASVFIEFQTRVEVSPNGASFRLHTRPARFVNVPELLTIITEFADLRGSEILAANRPVRREHIITMEPSEAVQRFVDGLVVRSEEIHRGVPRLINGKRDNMLWVTGDGRMAALDLSLVGREENHAPKLEAVAREMVAIYQRWQQEAAFLDGEFKSLQIGFCDLGTPNKERGDQLYGKLKRLLIAAGIPAHGIRFIHEASTDAAKAVLFQQCRSGQVAMLLGSTTLLGVGTNIQTRAVALHHIDAPWRPDEVEQREGRIWRPGNLYPEVEIFRYVQRRTFDAYSWQTLANKAVFFDQMRSGRLKGREVEVLDSALSYGQVKAAATGDPLVLEQANLEVTVAHLHRLRAVHARARHRDAQEATRAREQAAQTARLADALHQIAQQMTAHAPGFVTAQQRPLAGRTAIGEYIAERLRHLVRHDGGKEWLVLCHPSIEG